MKGYKEIKYLTIFCSDNDSTRLNTTDLHHPWYNIENGKTILIVGRTVISEDKLIEDLLNMVSQNVYGYLTVKSEDGSYTELQLIPEEACIKAFRGGVTYSDKPYKTFKKEQKESEQPK